jgi:CheY-like chemotaxis protein
VYGWPPATLRLQENPGGGTIATLTLQHARPASARILVIEDEHAIRDAITYTLQTDGYQVTEAATGQDGLSAARQEHFDLIIIDMLLPDIPGTDLTRQRRRHTRPGAVRRRRPVMAPAGGRRPARRTRCR